MFSNNTQVAKIQNWVARRKFTWQLTEIFTSGLQYFPTKFWIHPVWHWAEWYVPKQNLPHSRLGKKHILSVRKTTIQLLLGFLGIQFLELPPPLKNKKPLLGVKNAAFPFILVYFGYPVPGTDGRTYHILVQEKSISLVSERQLFSYFWVFWVSSSWNCRLHLRTKNPSQVSKMQHFHSFLCILGIQFLEPMVALKSKVYIKLQKSRLLISRISENIVINKLYMQLPPSSEAHFVFGPMEIKSVEMRSLSVPATGNPNYTEMSE